MGMGNIGFRMEELIVMAYKVPACKVSTSYVTMLKSLATPFTSEH